MSAGNLVKVWDPVVRIGHWLLAALFALAYITGERGSEFHAYAGYALIGIVAFRVVWGFTGTRHARFADFLHGPRTTLAYLRSFAAGRPLHYLGHNPAGGWMIVLLLAMLVMSTWTGLETYGAQGKGPLAVGATAEPAAVQLVARAIAPAYADDGGRRKVKRRRSPAERFWKELHEGFVNATVLLVLLHIAGAIVSSIVHRENLIKAMITGYKSPAPRE
ncbi:MAG: cytochrome B [Gammaproteobacteria bacterium]|nr:cytochrome B [Gammaproteobacteria bacterium]